MKKFIRISIFALISALLVMMFAVSAFATDAVETNAAKNEEAVTEAETSNKIGMNEKPEAFSPRAVEIALQGTATGMIMIFAVLGLLAIIMTLSKIVFYDIPNKKKEEANRAADSASAASAPVEVPVEAPATSAPAQEADDGELAAVITAAIAAMIESGDYKNEFVGGFRVVSFKRSNNTSSGKAWNR